MTKRIELTGKYGIGKFAIIDDNDFEILAKYKWHVKNGYPERSENINGKIIHVTMYREIISPPIGFVIDHINGDKLDNRRENLRICTPAENARNKRWNKSNTSGYKGVSYDKSKKKFAAYVSNRHIGYFDNAIDAAKAYDFYALKFHKEFAALNFPNDESQEPIKRELTSSFRGVSWCKRDQVWRPQIQKQGKRFCLGSFNDEIEAAKAYNTKAIELFGSVAILNVIPEVDYAD